MKTAKIFGGRVSRAVICVLLILSVLTFFTACRADAITRTPAQFLSRLNLAYTASLAWS